MAPRGNLGQGDTHVAWGSVRRARSEKGASSQSGRVRNSHREMISC